MHLLALATSMSTSSRTLTFSPIIDWQICSHLVATPSAFWMSSVRPAALNALSSAGRSLFSQRFEVTESGRITPTLPVACPPPALALALALPPAEVAGAEAEAADVAAPPAEVAGAAAEVAAPPAEVVGAAGVLLLLEQPVSTTAATALRAANFMARLDMR